MSSLSLSLSLSVWTWYHVLKGHYCLIEWLGGDRRLPGAAKGDRMRRGVHRVSGLRHRSHLWHRMMKRSQGLARHCLHHQFKNLSVRLVLAEKKFPAARKTIIFKVSRSLPPPGLGPGPRGHRDALKRIGFFCHGFPIKHSTHTRQTRTEFGFKSLSFTLFYRDSSTVTTE